MTIGTRQPRRRPRGERVAAVPVVQPAIAPDYRRAPAWALSCIVLGATLYAALFLSAIWKADTELLGGLAIAPILVGLTLPIAFRIARADHDPTLVGIVMGAVVLKLVAAWVRYWVAFEYYHGRSDATQYHFAGLGLAPFYRSFDFSEDIGPLIGTTFVKMLTGIVYAIVGASRVAGFFVFAWIGFIGLILMARAFKIGVPRGDSRRYLIAVLFLPSLVYWPSAIGKEAWMVLAIGLSAYGVAAMFRRRTGGLLAFAAGMFGILMVRPHIALIVFVGLLFAFLLRRTQARSYAVPLFRVVGLAVLVALGVLLASRTASFLGQDKLTTETVGEELTATEAQTTDGGSAFSPVRVNTPLDLVPAAVTVFIRPFPFEVSSPQELASAGEGVLLVGLLFASRKRIRSLPRLIRSTPYVAFSVGYGLGFVYAFSSFANFGILARQRAQAIPFLLVLLALPRYRDLVADDTADDTADGEHGGAEPTAHPDRSLGAGPPGVAIPSREGTRRRRRPAGPHGTRVTYGARGPTVTHAPAETRTVVSSGPAFAAPPRSGRPAHPEHPAS